MATRRPANAWRRFHCATNGAKPSAAKARSTSAKSSSTSASKWLRETARPSKSRSAAGWSISAAPEPSRKFSPMPMTACTGPFDGPAISIRTPPSLAQPASRRSRRSFGHFSITPTAPQRSSARATASPTARLRPESDAAPPANFHSREKARLPPRGACQARPLRPRPAVCSSATNTLPEGRLLVAATRSALVEAVTSTTCISNTDRAAFGNACASACKSSLSNARARSNSPLAVRLMPASAASRIAGTAPIASAGTASVRASAAIVTGFPASMARSMRTRRWSESSACRGPGMAHSRPAHLLHSTVRLQPAAGRKRSAQAAAAQAAMAKT